jgi:hydroxymethylpyrimidine/phosphomethylpyrimidine kinase
MIARVLIIAGSDSGGGAGVQADIKAVTVLGGYAATAITAITVQNSRGVSAVHPVPPAIVAAQIAAVLGDIGADAIKIGMLGTADTVHAVADALADALAGTRHGARLPIVLDPVMLAKGGAALIADDAVAAMVERLLPMATLITPNAPELAALCETDVADSADLLMVAQELLDMGPRAVLAKGGHLDGAELTDWLVWRGGQRAFTAGRIATRHTHGTGCTLASAVAVGLAQGLPLEAAVARGHAYVAGAIAAAPGFGSGHGPLGHGWMLGAPWQP